ncbi:hypothetical protein ASG52_22905 [Methylobacterium sp. Leaf456]|uniref:hypothetical protein n=1 Tax=Methylobacterium sp. Leaf456 TaxID=1736382 RepID=UPI0006F5F693|nr:hypothetical protein [Methylobacterium sp. Leaf456]KQT58062.1 hypothetical protein ASG52_22905 [Methylobacterium sp. Leaf456]
MRSLVYTVPIWVFGLHQARAQQTNPAPPIPESGPSGSNTIAANAAATDFNWIWLSLLIALAVLALWMVARRTQSRTPR